MGFETSTRLSSCGVQRAEEGGAATRPNRRVLESRGHATRWFHRPRPRDGLRPVHLRCTTVVVAARYGGAVSRLRPLMFVLVVAAATPTAAVVLTATDVRASAGSARVRSCGVVTLSGTSAVVRSYGTSPAAPLACPSARRILRRFIARGRPNGTQSGWACHMTSVQGGGYPADNAWCDRGSREIQASTDSYGE